MTANELKSQDTEISKKLIHHWAIIDTNLKEEITRFDITILDPADNIKKTMTYDEFKKFPHDDPLYLDYDWQDLEHMFERVKRVALENAKYRKIEHEKKTYNETIYKTVHYYHQTKVKGKFKDSEEKGVIIEKVSVDIDKNKKQPVKSTEYIIETFYLFAPEIDPNSPRKLWVYDSVLDDLLNRGVKDMRIVTDEGLFYIKTMTFLVHGSIDKQKVYIDLNTSTFKVYPNGEDFIVDT